MRKNDTVENREFNIHNIIDQGEVTDIIKRYEKIIKTGNKKTIRYKTIQGQILKKFKNKEGFFEKVWLSRSTICSKIGLYKGLKTVPSPKELKLVIALFQK